MKIDVIGASLTWENKQIIKSLKKRKIKTEFIDPRLISYDISKNIEVFYKDKEYKIPQKILCRGGFTKGVKDAGRIFINLMEMYKVKIYDKPLVIYSDQDKLYQSFIFSQFKIPHPHTYYLTSDNLLKQLKYPIVKKPLVGSKGKGITKTKSLKVVAKNKFLQELLSNSYQDIRVLVIGNKVIGAMQRTAKKGEWRSNYALGANIKMVKPDNIQKNLALRAVKKIGMVFAGVDIITDKNRKNYVLEVNRAPQFKGFVKATKINVSEKIADYLEFI